MVLLDIGLPRMSGYEVAHLDEIEELVRLSGGDIVIGRQVDRVGFEIRLRKADTAG